MYRRRSGYPRTLRKADLEAKADRARESLRSRSSGSQPVVIEGSKIAQSFWGQAWCRHLEGLADYSNRLPRGRTYVRSGAVVDLDIQPGLVKARVQGTRLYTVEIRISPCLPSRWKKLVARCSGSIDSVVALLQGQVAPAVIAHLIDPEFGLFPSPSDMQATCSCPDFASLCKHIAATFFGVGARLDRAPELFFRLRQVDQDDLFATAAAPLASPANSQPELTEDLAALFDLTFDEGSASIPERKTSPRKARAPTSRPPSTRAAAVEVGPAASPPATTNFDLTPRPTLTKPELLAAGFSEALIQRWIAGGVLRKTRSAESFRTTSRTFDVLRFALFPS